MTDVRRRIQLDDVYALALGRAAYNFAYLEWGAVWCRERLQPDYLKSLKKSRKTAGKIASDFFCLVSGISDANLQKACTGPAYEFWCLVETRNAILHGTPGTAKGGHQRLFRGGKAWTPSMLDDAADEFAECGVRMGELLYGVLSKPPST